MAKKGGTVQVAKAIVTVIPSMEGSRGKISEMLGAEAGKAGKSAGSTIGSGISGGISGAKLAIGNALGNIISSIAGKATETLKGAFSDAFNGFADYQQLSGGVETMFKGAAGKVEGYAKQAFETAGVSANQYMETVTGFSASLIASLGGDTEKAADIANMALTDMSDNANKMGSDFSSLEYAYQGFAKQNYTMLDNLKLGYGGTKTEMQRLLKDASELTKAQGEYREFSIDSYSDIIEAIHLVQSNMDITGTTAEEAATTIQGAMGMAKASWENFLAGLANPDADMGELTRNLIGSLRTAFSNIEPAIKDMLKGAFEGGLDILDEIGLGGAANFLRGVSDAFNGPVIQGAIDKAVDFAKGIADAFASPEVERAAGFVANTFGGIFESLIELFNEFAPSGDAAGDVIRTIADAVSWVAETVRQVWPIVEGVLKFVGDVGGAVLGAAWEILKAIGEVVAEIGSAFLEELAPGLVEFGEIDLSNLAGSLKDVIGFVKDLILSGLQWLKDNGPEIGSILGKIGGIVFTAFSIASEVIGGVVEVIGELYGKLADFFQNDPVGQKIGSFIGDAVSAIGDFIGWMLDTIGACYEAVLNWLRETDENGHTHWENLTTFLGEAIKVAGDVIGGVVEFVTGVVETMSAVFDAVTGAVRDTWNGLVDFFANDPLGQKIKETFDGIIQFMNGAWETISGIVKTAVGFVKGVVTGDWSLMADGVKGIQQGLGDMLSGAWNAITSAIESAVRGVAKFLSSAWDEISRVANDVWNGLVEFFSGLPGRIVEVFVNLPRDLANIFEQAAETAPKAFGAIVNKISDIPRKIINLFSQIPGAISKIFSNIHIPQLHVSGGFNLDPANFSVPKIDLYAAGFGVTRPTYISGIAGEAGGEALVPFERSSAIQPLAQAIAGELNGGGVTYNIWMNDWLLNDDDAIRQGAINLMNEIMRRGDMNRG